MVLLFNKEGNTKDLLVNNEVVSDQAQTGPEQNYLLKHFPLVKMARLAMHKTGNMLLLASETGFGGSPVTTLEGCNVITTLLFDT